MKKQGGSGNWLQGLFFSCLLLIAMYFSQSGGHFIDSIAAPLFSDESVPISLQTQEALQQTYRFLGKGRQSFAFLSADGKWVLKFFNQKYHQTPFYATWCKKVKKTRELRRQFYLESYKIAADLLPHETGIQYLHIAPAREALPRVALFDQKGHKHQVDLNHIPFVLQKKVEPFYSTLEAIYKEEGQQALDAAIHQYLSLIALRISKGIKDRDHDVEHNFGFYEGTVIHLDPGRFSMENGVLDEAQLKQEWWRATHRFRNWLQQKHPESLSFFDQRSTLPH